MLEIMSLPFFRTALLACFLLAGIHAYLGFHPVQVSFECDAFAGQQPV